ncbi:hypothetical protein [Zhihengliuella halotolerans]|uniref:hypothetical protein n=1 Tax=Zhihengliuella halotolerans TaxID=370736 RepID=UPI0011AECB36|nr:hypothetical protein [Zhihengliuella halotolerans]
MSSMKTSELLKALRAHYIEPGADTPGGTFVGEVGVNGKFGASSRCDALYAGFTSASGRILIGHELKVSRADWRHELDQLDKADWWADNCHAWYVVAPSTDIVPPEELPAGWGLMVPNSRAKRRMTIVVKAQIHADRTPSWDATRSMMARLDTLRGQEVRETVANKMIARTKELEERMEARVRPAISLDDERRIRLARELEEQYGVDLAFASDGIGVTEFQQALQVAREIRKLPGQHAYGGLIRAVSEAEDAAATLRRLQAALAPITATINLKESR